MARGRERAQASAEILDPGSAWPSLVSLCRYARACACLCARTGVCAGRFVCTQVCVCAGSCVSHIHLVATQPPPVRLWRNQTPRELASEPWLLTDRSSRGSSSEPQTCQPTGHRARAAGDRKGGRFWWKFPSTGSNPTKGKCGTKPCFWMGPDRAFIRMLSTPERTDQQAAAWPPRGSARGAGESACCLGSEWGFSSSTLVQRSRKGHRASPRT